MISYDNAQQYFSASSHYKAAVWSGFNSPQRVGAIAMARRVLARALGRAMNDNEAPYKEGDRTRDEYAVYEQALWMLENGQVADATGNDPVPVITGLPDVADVKSSSALFGPETLRWLGWTGAAVIRG